MIPLDDQGEHLLNYDNTNAGSSFETPYTWTSEEGIDAPASKTIFTNPKKGNQVALKCPFCDLPWKFVVQKHMFDQIMAKHQKIANSALEDGCLDSSFLKDVVDSENFFFNDSWEDVKMGTKTENSEGSKLAYNPQNTVRTIVRHFYCMHRDKCNTRNDIDSKVPGAWTLYVRTFRMNKGDDSDLGLQLM